MLEVILMKIWWPMLLNLLWLFHAFKGGFVLGLWPASYALIQTIKDSDATDIDIRVHYQTFKNYYREMFWRANRIGLAYSIVLLVLLWDLHLALQIKHVVALLSSCCLMAVILQWLLVGAHMVVSGDKLKVHSTTGFFKFNLKSSFSSLKANALLIVSISGCFLIASWIPGLIVFYGVSIPLMLIANILKSKNGGSTSECMDSVT